MSHLKRRRLVLAALLGVFLAAAARAAYLTDVPTTLTQPDGTVLSLLSTGDEFYNWVHDAAGYVMVRDPDTGWIVYAAQEDGQIVPTPYVVGTVDPAAVGLVPNIRPDAAQVEARRAARMAPMMAPDGATPAPKTGTMNNIVIFIRFSDNPEFTTQRYVYNNMFNDPYGNSLHGYYAEASYGKLFINSSFYPETTGGTVVSYQDINPRGYYSPYNATTNPIGYKDGQTATREHGLLTRAIDAVRSQIPSDMNLDIDGDGNVDSIAFIVYGNTDGWAELLWPHAWSLYSSTVRINGKRVYNYSFQIASSTMSSGAGVLAHETGHTLGIPDFYRYDGNSPASNPLGGWDVMASNQNPPQHMTAYIKHRYMGWIADMPTITQSGVYTLNPLVSPTGNCFKIPSPNSTTEYFVVEYRRKIGIFEQKIPSEGLVIYRVNTKKSGNGNAQGPPDELYVYRRNGTLTSNGTISQANFSSNSGRTAFNDTTNPSAFLSDGGPSGVSISDVGALGDTISFRVNMSALLRFAAVYGSAREDDVLPFTVRVGIFGPDNKLITDATDPVTVSIKPGTGTPGATLSGTTTVFAVNGTATFTGLSVDKAGTGYRLQATVANASDAESGLFNVTPFQFTFYDTVTALRWAAGLDEMPASKMPRWDAVTEEESAGAVDMADVTAILLKAQGLMPNP